MKISNQTNGYVPEFQVEGDIVYSADVRHRPGAEHIKHSMRFVVARKGKQWKIRTTNLKEDHFDDGTDYQEMSCDGTNIFELSQCDANDPNISSVKDIITAQGRVRRGDAPAGLDSGFIYPLWIAYCSSNYFLSRRDNRISTPLFMTEDSLGRAVPPTLQLPAEWKLNDSHFVSEIAWHSEGKELAEDGTSRLIPLPPPFDSGFLRASFKTTDWIGFSGICLPRAFIVRNFFPNWKTGQCETRYIIEAKAQAIRPLRDISFVPELSKKALITDTRFHISAGCSNLLSYGSLSWMTEDEVEAKCKSKGIEYEKQSSQSFV